MVRLDASLNVLDIPLYYKSLMMECVRYPSCSLITDVCILVIHSSSMYMDGVLLNSIPWEIDLKRLLLSYNTVIVAVSRNFPSHPAAAVAVAVLGCKRVDLSEILLSGHNLAALSCEQ